MSTTTTTTTVQAEPGTHLLTMSREFDAPAALVFRAHTEPDLLARWLGPRRLQMRVEEFDVRDGGRWSYVHFDEDGVEHGFHGVFHGTPSVERGIVQTFEYDGAPGHVSLETSTFEPRGGRTLLRMSSVFQSVADRDAMIASGMEEGARDSMARLEELLATL